MYKEIHPYFYDSFTESGDIISGQNKKESDYYIPSPSTQVLRLDTIRRIIDMPNSDNTVTLCNLVINDSYQDNIIVSKEEAEEIKTMLLKQGKDNHIPELVTVINRLILAIDRLGVKIPSSIRMHM